MGIVGNEGDNREMVWYRRRGIIDEVCDGWGGEGRRGKREMMAEEEGTGSIKLH